MKQVHIWLFCISLLCQGMLAQTKSTEANSLGNLEENPSPQILTDSISYAKAIRFGTDLYRLVRSQADKNFQGWEIAADFRWLPELYIAFEMGDETHTIQREQINFTSQGSYLKLGIDYNLYENWPGMNNQVYLGLRYATSAHMQQVNRYLVYNRNHFWPDRETDRGHSTGLREGLSANWVEVVAGMKVEVIKNVFMGFSARLTRLLSDQKPENFDNLYIPGFNRKTDENVFGANFNYSLTYSIPLFNGKKAKVPQSGL